MGNYKTNKAYVRVYVQTHGVSRTVMCGREVRFKSIKQFAQDNHLVIYV